MSVHIAELHTTVEATPSAPAGASSGQSQPGEDERARRYRELLARLVRDTGRTRAEGYDD